MRSKKVYAGPGRIEARALLYATGKLEKEIGKKPLVGIVNSFNEIVPGHFHLRTLVEAAKLGVAAGDEAYIIFIFRDDAFPLHT